MFLICKKWDVPKKNNILEMISIWNIYKRFRKKVLYSRFVQVLEVLAVNPGKVLEIENAEKVLKIGKKVLESPGNWES